MQKWGRRGKHMATISSVSEHGSACHQRCCGGRHTREAMGNSVGVIVIAASTLVPWEGGACCGHRRHNMGDGIVIWRGVPREGMGMTDQMHIYSRARAISLRARAAHQNWDFIDSHCTSFHT
ncbi:hypothetical protein BDZ97DRAFT_1754877 [Flammula alnicola]|nr:hypothetical protein BDZ97DRAFT_1754877 [Flammula alnicola]